MHIISSHVLGCAQTKQAKKVKPAGFLEDYYAVLQEGKDDEALFIYRNSEVDFSVYKKVIIDPVEVWIGKDSKVPAEELQNLANRLYHTVINKLEDDYIIVTQPGPDVMRIRLALTGAKKSKVAMNILTTIIPAARLMSGAKELATGTNTFVGEASIEAKIEDSDVEEVIVAAMDRRAGKKYLKGSTNAWRDVEQTFEYWADKLGQRLREWRTK